MLVIWANTVGDMATILNNEQDIGWQVKMSGAIAETMFAEPVAKLVQRTVSITSRRSPFEDGRIVPATRSRICPSFSSRSVWPLSTLVSRKRLAPTIVGWAYDAIYVLKAGIESGAQSGPEIAAWIEKNAASVTTVSGKLDGAGPKSHFLVGIGGMTMVDGLDSPGPEGLFRRTDCPKM